MKMKRNICTAAAALMAAAMLTACSSGTGGSDTANYLQSGEKNSFAENSSDAGYGYDSDTYDYYGSEEAKGSSDSVSEADAMANAPEKSEETVQKEMLVYSCNMTVDTLEFDAALSGFKTALEEYGGFVETENYSDGGSGGRWYREGEQKWKSYTATVRIPGGSYEEFVNMAGNLGDLRSKTSSVENLSREYSDLSTTLEIYLAKEERYIARLSEITDEEYALQVERELTDIQIQIANIRNRMSTIRTDVAYSYVYITLNEVKEYVSEPVKTDTFGDRLLITLKSAGSGFLYFLEKLLFVIIYTGPYIIFIGIIGFIIYKTARALSKRRRAKATAGMPAGMPNMQHTPNTQNMGAGNPAAPPVYSVHANNGSESGLTKKSADTENVSQDKDADKKKK